MRRSDSFDPAQLNKSINQYIISATKTTQENKEIMKKSSTTDDKYTDLNVPLRKNRL